MSDLYHTIPEGFGHKATSESFSGTEKVVIYHSRSEDLYLVVLHSKLNEDSEEIGVYVDKTQLELIVQSANDVLDMRHG